MIYTNDVLEQLQIAINNGNYTITSFNKLEDLPKNVYLNGVKLSLLNNEGKHDTIAYQDYGLLTESISEWRKTAANKFLAKDWKFYEKDKYKDNFVKYREITITINEIITKVLARQITVEELDNDEEQFNLFNDLVIDDDSYAIIKAYIENTQESYSIKSALEEDVQKWLLYEERVKTWSDLDGFEAYEEESDDIDSQQDNDIYETEELF